MAITYGNKLSVWSTYLDTTFEGTYSATQARLTIRVGVYFNSKHEHTKDYDTYWTTPTGSTSDSKVSGAPSAGNVTQNAGTRLQYTTRTIFFNRTTTAYTGKVSASIKHAKGTESWRGTSTTTQSFTIPARTAYAVTYNANTPATARGTVTDVPANQTKYYGINLGLSSSAPKLANWIFKGWNTTSDGSGTQYAIGATYTGNAALTLYAQWEKIFIVPTISNVEFQRVEADLAENDEGNYLRVTFNHTQGQAPDDATVDKTTTVSMSLNGNTLSVFSGTSTFNTTGTKTIVFTAPTSTYPTTESYPITITLTTAGGVPTVTYLDTLASSIYPIDLAANASTMAFGVPIRAKQGIYLNVDPVDDNELYDALVALGWWTTVSNGGVIEE